MLAAAQSLHLCAPRLRLTHPHADARSAKGDDAGDLKRPAALWAHQTVPGLQTALGTAAARASALRDLVFLGLGLPRVAVFFVPLLALAFSHNAFSCLTKSRWNVSLRGRMDQICGEKARNVMLCVRHSFPGAEFSRGIR